MKPILFSTPMVQAILAGRKTQTRRLIKEAAGWDYNWKVSQVKVERLDGIPRYEMRCGTQYSLPWFKSKYQPGDILYVRETYYAWGFWDEKEGEFTKSGKPAKWFVDCTAVSGRCYHFEDSPPDMNKKYESQKWHKRPSLFMPKDAARILLQVTDVRAERLQDITEEDAIAEGIECIHESDVKVYRNYLIKEKLGSTNPVRSFTSLWNSINAKTSPWEKNDWVWVYSFNKIKKPELWDSLQTSSAQR